ncbi:MAG: hypothetical protein EBX90_05780, partial [Betaproteobacteria bacterium]|nr:hypothetical protein [Betaproteobacteria bacterium]
MGHVLFQCRGFSVNNALEGQLMGEGQKHSNRVAIAGMGAIGRKIALALDQGIPGMTLTAVAVGSPEKASSFLVNLKHPPQVLSLSDLA